jgi:hypothetical protein
MPDRQVCIDCGTLSPETETNYTLISSQFGWRLTRTRTIDGQFNVEWRCPACWKEHKRLKQAAEEARGESRGSSVPPIAPSSPPLGTRPLPSFASRPPPPGAEDEPKTLQRQVLQRPSTPVMPMRTPRTPLPDSPIPGRLPPPRSPRR